MSLLAAFLVSTAAAGNVVLDLSYTPGASDVQFQGCSAVVAPVKVTTDIARYVNNPDKVKEKSGEAAGRGTLIGVSKNALNMVVVRYVVATPIGDELRAAVLDELAAVGCPQPVEGAGRAPRYTIEMDVREFFFEITPKALQVEFDFRASVDVRIMGSAGNLVWAGRSEHASRTPKVAWLPNTIRSSIDSDFARLVRSVVRDNGAVVQALTADLAQTRR